MVGSFAEVFFFPESAKQHCLNDEMHKLTFKNADTASLPVWGAAVP